MANVSSKSLQPTWPHKMDVHVATAWSHLAKLLTFYILKILFNGHTCICWCCWAQQAKWDDSKSGSRNTPKEVLAIRVQTQSTQHQWNLKFYAQQTDGDLIHLSEVRGHCNWVFAWNIEDRRRNGKRQKRINKGGLESTMRWQLRSYRVKINICDRV